MSEDTPAVSPELTADEKAQLESLQAKDREAAAAKAAEEAEEARLKQEEEDARIADRPLFHVLVRHCARSAKTRTMRAARAGHRRQGAILDNGIRIRKRGRRRYTELDLRELVTEHERLLEYVRVGTLEVCDPKSENVIPYEDLVKMIGHVAAWLEDHKAHQAEEMYAKEMEDYESAMEVYEEKLKVWEDALKEYEKAEKEHKKAVSKLKEGEEAPEFTAKPPPAKPVEPEKPEKPELEKSVMEITDPSEGQDALPTAVHGLSDIPPGAAYLELELADFGDNPIAVVRVLRNMTSLSIKDAAELRDDLPVSVGKFVDEEAAKGLAEALEEAGATVHGKLVTPDKDVTKPSMEPAVLAAEERKRLEDEEEVDEDEDLEEGEDEGEEEEEENGNGMTEDELMKMTRPELNEAALEYGVEDPESLSSKEKVVAAIFALQENGEE